MNSQPPSRTPGGRRRPLNDEDRALWDAVAKTIVPLPDAARRHGVIGVDALADAMAQSASAQSSRAEAVGLGGQDVGPVTDAVAKRAAAARLRPAASLGYSSASDGDIERLWAFGVGTGGAGVPVASPVSGFLPLQHGTSPGVDRRTADRFRKGRMTVDGRIDLHGMTQEQAHGALHRFIESQAHLGGRCVLVITGKGLRGEGVLRRMVPRWLNDSRLRPLILSFSHAQIADGGDGAMYVLLRRQRDAS